MTQDHSPSRPLTMWLLWLIVMIQQLTFLFMAGLRVMLLYISGWVLPAPVIILWIAYLIAPFIYEQPLSWPKILRSFATKGWLFVIAALAWFLAYFHYSETQGTPVSWDAVQEAFRQRERLLLEESVPQASPAPDSNAPVKP